MKGTFQFTIHVAPAPLSAGKIPDMQVGQPTGGVLPIAGGVGPYTLSNAQGALPPGVTFNAKGELSGTPLVPGDYSFSVDVDDSQ